MIHILSLSNSHINVAAIQKNRGDKSYCVIVAEGFSIVFPAPDWLKLNHLKSRMECGFSDIFSSHICSTVAETIDVTNYAASFGAKNVQKATFEATEMILGPWDQEVTTPGCKYYDFKGQPFQYDMKKNYFIYFTWLTAPFGAIL